MYVPKRNQTLSIEWMKYSYSSTAGKSVSSSDQRSTMRSCTTKPKICYYVLYFIYGLAPPRSSILHMNMLGYVIFMLHTTNPGTAILCHYQKYFFIFLRPKIHVCRIYQPRTNSIKAVKFRACDAAQYCNSVFRKEYPVFQTFLAPLSPPTPHSILHMNMLRYVIFYAANQFF